jgi:hypothetical protein
MPNVLAHPAPRQSTRLNSLNRRRRRSHRNGWPGDTGETRLRTAPPDTPDRVVLALVETRFIVLLCSALIQRTELVAEPSPVSQFR